MNLRQRAAITEKRASKLRKTAMKASLFSSVLAVTSINGVIYVVVFQVVVYVEHIGHAIKQFALELGSKGLHIFSLNPGWLCQFHLSFDIKKTSRSWAWSN